MDNQGPEPGVSVMEQLLSRVDPIKLFKKITAFRQLDIRKMSDEQIKNAVLGVLLNNVFTFYTTNGTYPEKTLFFRVRKLNSGDVSQLKNLTIGDFWEPPPACVKKPGRLNKTGESVLYTSPVYPQVAINEVRIKKGDWYALIRYTAKKEILVNIIGGEYHYEQMGMKNKKAIMILELYRNFLRDEFSRNVEEGTEYLYRVSEPIAKFYFNLPRELQDAWCYPSVLDKEKYNVCFQPEIGHELLHLDGALICLKGKSNTIHARCIAIPQEKTGKTELFEIGSEMQKKIFPEIKTVR